MSADAKARYDARTAYNVSLKLNRRTDADIIAALEAVPNKQGLIKAALRAHVGKKENRE